MNLLSPQFSVLPGFRLTFGLGVGYLTILVLFPIAVLTVFSFSNGAGAFFDAISGREVMSALRFTLICSFLSAAINLVLGLILAFTLEGYRFPGRRFIDACLDLPFALPTAVAGIAISFLLSPDGIIGSLLGSIGLSLQGADYISVTAALVFVGLPFVPRTLQPVIAAMDKSQSEAARTLGANGFQTVTRIILPQVMPAALTGFSLALARAIGEYGSVIFVASNLPYKSQILPVVIVGKIESHLYEKAAAIGVFMLAISVGLLIAVTLLKKWSSGRGE